MTIGELLVKLGLDPSSYHAGLSGVESKTKTSGAAVGKSFDEAGGHVSKFGSILSGIGTGIGIGVFNLATEGIGKVVSVLGDSEKAYQDAAVSQAQLNTSIDNNITATGDQTITTQATADALDKTMQANLRLGFSMDEQRASMALLLGVTHDTVEAQKLQAAAMDLARLKGVDLATATGVLMKAAEGNTKGLKAYGITVVPVTAAVDALKASTKKYTAEQMAAAKATDKAATVTAMLGDVTALSKGQADAFAETSAGKLAAGHAKVTEAMVKLGAITDKITQAVLPALADAFGNIMTAIGPVLDEIGAQMPGAIAKANAAMDWLSTNVLPTVRASLDWISTNVIPALAASFTWIQENVIPALGKAFDWISINVIPPLQAAFKAISEQALPAIRDAFDWIVQNVLPSVVSALQFIANDVMPKVGAAIDFIVKDVLPPLNAALDWIGKNVLPALGAAFKWIGQTVIPAVIGAIATVSGAVGDMASGIGDAISAVQTILGDLKDDFDGLVAFVTGLPGRITTAAGGMFDGIWQAFKAAINNIIRGWNSLEFKFGGIDMGPLGKMASFDLKVPQIPYLHAGGIVPGTPGSNVLAMLQAGERVTPRGQAQQTGTTNVTINNPTPEPASTSIQDTLLRLVATGYLPKPQGAY